MDSHAPDDHIQPPATPPTPPLDDRLRRLIRNAHREHSLCPMRTGAFGLEDYGRLAHELARVPLDVLKRCLDEIDAVRQSHHECSACSLKFLAFCLVFTEGRLPDRHGRYSAEYHHRLREYCDERDFQLEIRRAIEQAAVPLRLLSAVNESREHSPSAVAEPRSGSDRNPMRDSGPRPPPLL